MCYKGRLVGENLRRFAGQSPNELCDTARPVPLAGIISEQIVIRSLKLVSLPQVSHRIVFGEILNGYQQSSSFLK